jgi:hypothetical protein
LKRFEDIEKNNGQYTLEQVSENVGIIQNRAQFIPGRFYSFKIASQVPNLNEQNVPFLNDGKPYLDLRPCGLALFHENWKETALILNLKVIPTPVCAKLMEAYYAFSSQNGMPSLFKEGELIDLTERRLLDKKFYFVTTTILSQIIGVSNLNYSINKYNIDTIAEARLIDWDNFGMLVRPRVSQVGLFPNTLSIVEIFEQFITNSII